MTNLATQLERSVCRWLGVAFSSLLIAFCGGVMLMDMYIPRLLAKPSLLEIVSFIIFLLSFILAWWSFYCVCTVRPGVPPQWFAQKTMEAFVQDTLRGILQRNTETTPTTEETNTPSLPNTTHTPRSVTDDLVTPQTAEVRIEPHEVSLKEKEKEEEEEEGIGVNEGSEEWRIHSQPHPRHRRRYHPHCVALAPEVNIRTAAADALAAMGRSLDALEQEMMFLLNGARLCRFCAVYKLEETHHCSRCRMCVRAMDHHCPWIGQCVGRDNHKTFFLFLLYTFIAAVTAVVHTTVLVAQETIPLFSHGNPSLLVFVFIVTNAFAIVLCVLFVQSVCLLLHGETTLRRIRHEEHRILARQQRWEGGHPFALLLSEETTPNEGVCQVSNGRRVFGMGPVSWRWVLPLAPSWGSRAVEEELFWEKQGALMARQLHRMTVTQDAPSHTEDDANGEESEEIIVMENQKF